MENEEKDDLLVTELSTDSETESDICLQEKIAHLLDTTHIKHKSCVGCLLLMVASFLLFVSATILVIVLPIYAEHTRQCGISVYSKIAFLSTANMIIFFILFCTGQTILKYVPKWKSSVRLCLCLPKFLKLSSLLGFGSLLVFYLDNAQLVSCHLQDPLKGCVVVFALAFYFICSKKKTSVEGVFCTITVIVGTFVAVDFGLCDRYRCRGTELTNSQITSSSFHVINIIGYIIALAAYSLHVTFLQNCCRSSNYSSNLDMSIASSESSREISVDPMPITQSLSIISGGRGARGLALTIPGSGRGQRQRPSFPVTSTPNEGSDNAMWDPSRWLLAHHCFIWLAVVICCWIPSVELFNAESKHVIDVIEDVMSAIRSHVTGSECPSLWLPSSLFLAAYATFCVCSVYILLHTQSALLVACVCVNSLPMASVFWSIYQLIPSSPDLLKFNMNVTGETISAMLGFPIVGVGTFLLLKSHLTQNVIHMRMR